MPSSAQLLSPLFGRENAKEELKNKPALFKPNHPNKLRALIEDKGQDTQSAQQVLSTILPKLVPVVDGFIKQRIKKKISVTAITPKDRLIKSTENDAKILFNRTWIDKKYYTAPVEIDIYSNKVAILSFGKELIGIIIESPQIAKALKQLFLLSKKGAKQNNAF